MATSDLRWHLNATDGSALLHALRRPWRQHGIFALRSQVWPTVLAALLMLGLLLTFHHVVRDVVQQGEARRIAAAENHASVWRCNALRSHGQRASCLAQVEAALDASAAPLSPSLATPTTVALVNR